ncbi:MAG: M1 family metallopeptidase [Hyphomicrobiales bacterium]
MNRCLKIVAVILIALVSASLESQAARAAEPLHHDIQIVLNPGDGTVDVTDRITVVDRSSVTLSVAPWMRMSEIRIDGNAISDGVPGTSVTLAIPSAGKHRIDIVAKGTIPKEGAGQSSGADPVAGDEGLYLPGWAQWFPNTSDAAAAYRLTIETPSAHRAVATGKLQSEELGAETNRSVFTSQTMLEPPSVFAGPYVVTERGSGKPRIRTYFHDTVAGQAESYLEAAGRFITSYAQKIGAYPYADFHIVSAPLPVGLGFANLTYVDRRIVPLPFMRGRSLAHEVLHNWWGNGVHIDYETGNWAEGLTTYMADHALAEERGPDKAAEMRLGWLRDYAALPGDRDVAVTRFVSKKHDASQVVGYGKVAFIFHMLKQEVGAHRFDAAMQRFWSGNRFAVAGWSDIRAAFEQVTKSDLEWFFQQWTERAGAPRVTLEGAQASRGDKGYAVEISLAQDAAVYRLSVPVELTTEAGTRRFTIRLAGERAVERLELDAKPLNLRIDPDHALFRRLLPGEAPPILRDVLLDGGARTFVLQDDPPSREAARALAARMFGAEPAYLGDGQDGPPDAPFLVLGSPDQINSFISRYDLPERPARIAGQGSGRAWVARRKRGGAILFVEADGPEALRAMTRPLPHYRSRSFVTFDGRRAIAKGVWPSAGGPLAKKLD